MDDLGVPLFLAHPNSARMLTAPFCKYFFLSGFSGAEKKHILAAYLEH